MSGRTDGQMWRGIEACLTPRLFLGILGERGRGTPRVYDKRGTFTSVVTPVPRDLPVCGRGDC